MLCQLGDGCVDATVASLLGQLGDGCDVPLYACPECGDLGCGAITARVAEDHDSFAWLELGFETNYGDAPTDFLEVRPFYFDKRAYDAAIRGFWPRRR